MLRKDLIEAFDIAIKGARDPEMVRKIFEGEMKKMRTEIKWAELHSPIFVGGTNLSAKLDPTKRTGLRMEYDEDLRHLYVTWNNATARIPEPSILSMIEGATKEDKPKPSPVQGGKPIKAQVSTPQDHVHAGMGAGKTNSK